MKRLETMCLYSLFFGVMFFFKRKECSIKNTPMAETPRPNKEILKRVTSEDCTQRYHLKGRGRNPKLWALKGLPNYRAYLYDRF